MKIAHMALPLVALLPLACNSSGSSEADDGWVELFDGPTLDDGAITGRQGPERQGGLL